MGEREKGMEKNLIIPSFAISTDRKPIDEELETAFIYYMVQREKKKSFIRKEQETVSFIVKGYYGIWAYPYNNKWIFIDPLNLHSFSLTAFESPSLDEFISQLKDAHNSRNIFDSVLVRHKTTFSHLSKKMYEVKGLIDKPLALAIISYVKDVGAVSDLHPNSLMLPLRMDERKMLEVVHELNKVRRDLENSIAKFDEAIKVLDEETSFHMAQIDEEIKGIDNEYKNQIEFTTEIIDRSVEQLKTKKELEMKIVLARFEERKEFFNTQIGEYRKLLMNLKKDYDTLKEMLDSSKERSYAELWRKILKDIATRMEGIEKEIQEIQSVIKALEDERSKEVSSIEDAYKQLIESKMKPINDIAMERELEIKKRREEARDLSNKSLDIKRQILSMYGYAKASLEHLDQLPLKEFEGDRPKLLCLPFFFICYEDMKGRKRYKTYSPSIVQSPSSRLPLKWMRGISSQPLRPYSGQIMSIFEKFIKNLEADPVFEGEIYKMSKKLDLLSYYETRKQISEAINALMERGWILHRQGSQLKKSLEVMSL
jgi:hypothetical protein